MAKKHTGSQALKGIRNKDLYPNPNYSPTEQDMAIDNLLLGARIGNYNAQHGHIGYDALYDPSLVQVQETNNDTSQFGNGRLDNSLYNYGASSFDEDILTNPTQEDVQNTRAYNEPWWLKITNGVAKGAVTAATTALETIGLLYGIPQGIYNAANAEEGHGLEEFGRGFWDNPITNALHDLNEASEELMPNYYSTDEQAHPLAWRNIFSANTLGDKIIKNFGFMVGAYYGGIPAASLLGKVGQTAAKTAKAAQEAKMAGMAARAARLEKEAAGDKELLTKLLGEARLTDSDFKAARTLGDKRIRDIAGITRQTSKFIGALGSSLNEGAIEAINNSNDWANEQKQKAYDEYQTKLMAVDKAYKGTEMETKLKIQLADDYNKALKEIDRGKARMGNADLLLNIPILMASNIYQFGKLYQRGFDSTRRIVGNGLIGSLKEGTLKPSITTTKAVVKGLMKANSEGMEEYFQRAASDGAGQAVSDSITDYINRGKGDEAKNDVSDYIKGFAHSIAKNFGDENAMDEYFVGAVSSLIGMPVFGSQTKNAFIGKNGPVGLAGGLWGNIQDELHKRDEQLALANYLNGRVNKPETKALWHNLFAQNDLEKRIDEYVLSDDKKNAKDLEMEQLFRDINAAASSGHLDEFLDMIKYDEDDYTPEALAEVVKNTSRKVTAEEQRQRDQHNSKAISAQIKKLEDELDKIYHFDVPDSASEEEKKELNEKNKAASFRRQAINDEIDNLNREKEKYDTRLEEDKNGSNMYQDTIEGPFVDKAGSMAIRKDEDGVVGGEMIKILKENQKHIEDSVHEILNIRNAIDIETDGRLNDKDLELLSLLRTKIWNYDQRSAQMAEKIVDKLYGVYKSDVSKYEQEVEELEGELEQAKTEKAKVEGDKSSKDEDKKNANKKVTKAEQALKKAQSKLAVGKIINRMHDALIEEVEMGPVERLAYKKGYKRSVSMRNKNSEEVSAILADPMSAYLLFGYVNDLYQGSDKEKIELLRDIVDMSQLGSQKLKYAKYLKKALGDPSILKNEAFKNADEKLEAEERDNIVNDFSLKIKSATSLTELDTTMNNLFRSHHELAQQALDKVEKEGTASQKELIAAYKKAVSYYRSFNAQLGKHKSSAPDEVLTSIILSIGNAWNSALTEVDPQNAFKANMVDAAQKLSEDGNPTAQEAGKILTQILKDLGDAESSVKTHPKDKVSGGFAASTRESTTIKEGKEKKDKESPKERTKDEIESDIKEEVRKNYKDAKISTFTGLSPKLQDEIKKYNESHPDNKIQESLIAEYVEKLTDADIKDAAYDEDKDDKEDPDDSLVSKVAEDMKEELSGHYKSGIPTKYHIGDAGNHLDYKIPYEPEGENAELWKKVQKLLIDNKAYDFLDKNYLGYIHQWNSFNNRNTTIHFLKSADSQFGKGTNDSVVFMAIEWDKYAQEAIKKYAYNNYTRDFTKDPNIHLITIDGKQYQIVGVLTVDSNATGEAQEAFWKVEKAINTELKPKIDQLQEEGSATAETFVISDKTTKISRIFTGRLDKRDDVDDLGEDIPTSKWLTHNADREGRQLSIEWQTGQTFPIGIVKGNDCEMRDKGSLPSVTLDNAYLEKNQGAILLFLPRPDGQNYPVRLVRRTVKEWLDGEVTDGKTGKDLLNDYIEGKELKNAYIRQIIEDILTLASSDDLGKRVQAKKRLSLFFCFGKNVSPLSFNEGETGFTIRLKDEVRRDFAYDDTNRNQIILDFFNYLGDKGIKFSLPLNSWFGIDSKSILESGAFSINIRGFYNFNANFSVDPIDEEGHPITVSTPSDRPSTPASIRESKRTYEIGGKSQTFILKDDGTFTDEGGKPVDEKTQALLTFLEDARIGKGKDAVSFVVGDKVTPKERAYLEGEISGIAEVRIFTDTDGKIWVYDPQRAPGARTGRVYSTTRDAKEGILANIQAKHLTWLASLVKDERKGKKAESTSSSSFTQSVSTHDGYVYEADENGVIKVDPNTGEFIIQGPIPEVKGELKTLQRNGMLTIHRNGVTLDTATSYVVVKAGKTDIDPDPNDSDGKSTHYIFDKDKEKGKRVKTNKCEIILFGPSNKINRETWLDKNKGKTIWASDSEEKKTTKKVEKPNTKENKKVPPPNNTGTSRGRFTKPLQELAKKDSEDALVKTIKNLSQTEGFDKLYRLIQEAEQEGKSFNDEDIIASLQQWRKAKNLQKKKEALEGLKEKLRGCNKG